MKDRPATRFRKKRQEKSEKDEGQGKELSGLKKEANGV